MAEPPVTPDFLSDVAEEAAFQIEKWGETNDAEKDDMIWFWTLGHIIGKAVHDDDQTVEKQRHRLRAGAALLLNWDRHVAARAGIDAGPLMEMNDPGAAAVEGTEPAPADHDGHTINLGPVTVLDQCPTCGSDDRERLDQPCADRDLGLSPCMDGPDPWHSAPTEGDETHGG